MEGDFILHHEKLRGELAGLRPKINQHLEILEMRSLNPNSLTDQITNCSNEINDFIVHDLRSINYVNQKCYSSKYSKQRFYKFERKLKLE